MRFTARTLYTSVALVVACGGQAFAAKNVEVVRYPTLLMFGSVNQSVGVSYSYARHDTPNSSSSASALRESYSLGTVAAILNPHLVNLQIVAGLSYSQHFDDRTSTLLDGEYNIVASAFDMSYHPIQLISTRSSSMVSNGYTPTYTLTNNSNQISATLLNGKVPVQVYYVHGSSDTSGLEQDVSSTTDAAGIAMHHSYLDISDTRFSLNSSRSSSGSTESRGYSVSLGNFLSFDQQHRYRLSSSFNMVDTKSGEVPQRNISLAEELSCGFGSALSGSLSERFSYSETLDLSSRDQSSRVNTVAASLSHRLYQSITTSIAGSLTQGSALGGTNSNYGGTFRIAYTKKLPSQSNLMLTLDGSRLITSQDFEQSQITRQGEEHFGVNKGDRIVPDVPGRLTSVISVTRLKDFPGDPDVVYNETEHYIVHLDQGYIEIVQGSDFPDNSNIAITYTVETNPKISYRTDSIGTSGNLSLLAGRYTISGSFSSQGQTLLSGQATNQALVSTNNLLLRAMANFNPTQFGLEYGLLDSSQERSSQVSAYGSHTLRTVNNAVFGVSLRDTYAMVEPVGAGAEGTSQNTLSLAGSYSQRFFRLLNLILSLSASDSRSDGRSSDFVTLRGVLTGGYNQLQFSVSGQTLYRITGSGTTQDSNITCSVTRYF